MIGLAGAIFLILFGDAAGMSGSLGYSLLVVIASLLYSLSANTVNAYLQDMNAITISAVSFVLIGIPAIIYLFTATGFLNTLQQTPHAWSALGYVAILALFGTVIASILFFRLVQITNAVFASMVSYLIPIVALMWGFLVDEIITIYHIFGMLLILLGVYLSRR